MKRRCFSTEDRPLTFHTDRNINRLHDFVQSDRRITIRRSLNISEENVQTILRNMNFNTRELRAKIVLPFRSRVREFPACFTLLQFLSIHRFIQYLLRSKISRGDSIFGVQERYKENARQYFSRATLCFIYNQWKLSWIKCIGDNVDFDEDSNNNFH